MDIVEKGTLFVSIQIKYLNYERKTMMELEDIIAYVTDNNPNAMMFRNPDFLDAVIGYTINANGTPVLVYDYNKMIECLAKEYNESEDPATDAIEWVEYNTLRTLPYMQEDGRPVIIYT